MNSSKRDCKGRKLLRGESQRSNGMYQYRYIGLDGERHSVYSCRLVETDPIPPNSKNTVPLRELEKDVKKNLENEISKTKKLTFEDLFNKFIEMKFEIRQTTKDSYKELYDRYIKPKLGNRLIEKIKYSDIKTLYISLMTDNGLSGGTVKKIDCFIKQTFDLAVLDNMILSNPCTGVIKELRKASQFKPRKRTALTVEQQTALVKYVGKSPKYKCWLPLIVFLLGTGCRIGEAAGLYWSNVDFDNNMIHIDHSLTTISGKHSITEPKTDNGYRDIPMLDDVKNTLKALYVDGAEGYVFVNRHGHFIDRNYFNATLKKICRDFNLQSEDVKLPEDISPHVLRHTFCTRMCENESNVKVIQAVMGHSDISTTMDIYTDVFDSKKQEVFDNLNGKIILTA